jgi:hypothetical protein
VEQIQHFLHLLVSQNSQESLGGWQRDRLEEQISFVVLEDGSETSITNKIRQKEDSKPLSRQGEWTIGPASSPGDQWSVSESQCQTVPFFHFDSSLHRPNEQSKLSSSA